jgi:hypothetical protein
MLQIIAICSLFSYGMFTIQRPGFVLASLRTLWKKFPESIHESLFACGICVASIWGGGCYIYLMLLENYAPENYLTLLYLPVIIVCCSGVNAIFDRAVKAFEKHYGYHPPTKYKGEMQWSYLLPYAELRKTLVRQFLTDNLNRGHHVIEIGGYHDLYAHSKKYHAYGCNNKLDEHEILRLIHQFRNAGESYSVFIMGLYYEGNLRFLKKLIQSSHVTLIEYSDDGISRHQVELITEV